GHCRWVRRCRTRSVWRRSPRVPSPPCTRACDVVTAWRPALDKVWAFLRRDDGLRTDGHNIFVYHHPVEPGAPMEVDFGVEVSRPFTGADEVVFTHTPAGQVASTVHVGSPAELGTANAAVEAWCTAN